jgi:hypothetical protein
MYCKQPVSKFGCKNQVNHWRCGYYVSNEVLIKSLLSPLIFIGVLLLLAFTAVADDSNQDTSEPRYYTWVDAQGMMRNTLIAPAENAEKNSATKFLTTPLTTPLIPPKLDTSDYPSEEQYQKNVEEHAKENKPFYTWMDASGRLRSEFKPDVLVDLVAEEIIYDAVFAPPFRVPNYITQGDCCERYANAFTAVAELYGSASYHVNDTIFPFQTQSGNVAAGFFAIPKLADKEIVLLKAYQLPSKSSFEVVALDSTFKPLYLGSKLSGIFVEQTWKDLAYKKVMLEISDPDIKFLIVFVKHDESSLIQDNSKHIKALSNYRLSLIRDQLID